MNLATTLLNSVATQGSIFRSLRFRSSANAYLNRTPATAGNRKTWTFSAWIKRGSVTAEGTLLSGGSSAGRLAVFFNAGGQLISDLGGTGTYDQSTAVYRDPAAWYHFVWAFDTTQATAADRSRMYMNGVEVSLTQTRTFTQNTDYSINSDDTQTIGVLSNSLSAYLFDGYMTNVYFVDGQQLAPSAFGRTNQQTGVWEPTYFQGTYGANGYYLPFTNTASTTTLGYDFSGNSNNWTTNNVSLTLGATYDSVPDVPTLSNNVSSNYCTINPVMTSTSDVVVSNGALTVTSNYASGWQTAGSTLAVKTGKWYYEATASIVSASDKTSIGVLPETVAFIGNVNQDLSTYGISGHGAGTGGYSYVQGDTIMVAIDADNSKVYYGKNGTWFGTLDPSAGTGSTTQSMTAGVYYTPIFGGYGGSQWNVNFGQQTFSYTVPTGFKTLNAYNLPNNTIVQGNRVMDATLYTGTGSNLTVTNAAPFQPDLVWIKQRSGAQSHCLYDSVRGVTKQLNSNNTEVEGTYAGVSAFNTNGFSIGTADNNTNGATYVSWQWQAGQGNNTTNNDGTITSTVSVNPTAGFSIVTFTGNGSTSATVGHGLGIAPKLIITKDRNSSADYWHVMHTSLSTNYNVFLNRTEPQLFPPDGTISTSPTSTTFGFSTSGANVDAVNENGINVVAYCWAEVAGFSKFGSYTGNGSADGPFVNLGFKPKFLMTKRTDSSSSGDWNMVDTVRGTYNVVGPYVYANQSTAEGNAAIYDLLSNGFKIRETGAGTNASSSTYIYIAFAENPFKNALAR